MAHSPKFLAAVEDSKSRIRELTVTQVKQKLDRHEDFILVDCREDDEWKAGRIPGAIHIGKGVIERDIEAKVPDPKCEIVIYCGGGFRSAIAADALQKMGYTQVISMDGGIRGWREAGWPEER